MVSLSSSVPYNQTCSKRNCSQALAPACGALVLISAQKHGLWVFIRTASMRQFLRVPTIYVLSRNMKNIRVFLSENFQFLEMKFSIYLNRCVFLMFID